MAKKKYRIYKSGGEQGRIMNPTAQFLARAQEGMQQSSEEEMAMMQQQGQPQMQGGQEELMMMVDQIKQAILQTAPVQEILEFIVTSQLAPDLVNANEIYKQIKDELVNSGQLAQQESQDVAVAEEESSQDIPEAEEGMEARNADSATNDIPVGGRSEQLNKFIGTVQAQGNKAKAKEMMMVEEPQNVNPVIAKDGLTLNDRRTNRRIARFADQMSPMYDYSDRRQIRKGLNSGDMNMSDVFNKANMPALEKDDNELVETIDPETGSRIFVRNRKGIFGKLKQDIYAENMPLSQLSMMYGPSSYASGVYGNSSSINTTGSAYSNSAERRSQIYYTKPTVIKAAEDVNDDNIPEAAEVNSKTKSSKSSKSSGSKSSGLVKDGYTASKTAAAVANTPPATKALNSKIKNVEENSFLNSLTDAIMRQKQSEYNRAAIQSGKPEISMHGQGAMWLNDMIPDMTYREGEEYISGPSLDKPILDYVLGENALSVDEIIGLIGSDDVNLLQEYKQLFPTNSPEAIKIENYIINSSINQGAQSAEERQAAISAAKPFDPETSVYNKNESGFGQTLNTLGELFTNPTVRDQFLQMYSPFHQKGGYIEPDPLPAEYLKSQGFANATNQDLDSLLRGFNTDGYDSHWYQGGAENYGVTTDQLRLFASENRPKGFVNAAAYTQAMNKLSNDAGGTNVSNIPFAQNAMVMRTSADDLPIKKSYVAPQTLQEQGYFNETGTNAVNQDKSYSTGLAKRYGRGMYDHLVEEQDGGYIDSANPDLYKFTGGGDYFADGGTQYKDVTDPYLVQAQDGMMSEQPKSGETMKDYFIRTGRQDQLQYISPEQQGQVYGEGEAGVASLNDPYANEQNQYGAFTDPNDPNALESSIQEQADVTRSISGTGEADRDIGTTQQRARDEGYFGDDSMNFMSRYDAWKQGGKSQNLEDGYTSDSTSTDSTGAYGSYGGRRRGGRNLFPFMNSLTGGNRLVDRRDDLSYMEIKGLKKDANGNPIPIDMNRVTDFKSKASFNPLTGKSRYKNKIKFGDPEGTSNSKDKKGGFFNNIKDKAGSMIEGFGNRNKGKGEPASVSTNQQLGPSDEPTYQQQIEGDGREYDDLIMRDFDAASKANQNSTLTTSNRQFAKEMYPDSRVQSRSTRKKLNQGIDSREDVLADKERNRNVNERNALLNTPGNNSGQAPIRNTMMDAPNEDVQMLLNQQDMTSPNSTIEYFGDPRSQAGRFSYGTGGAYNTFQFGTSGVNNAMLDAANILQGQQQGIENLDRIANNPNGEMATNSRYIDGERVMEEDAEGEEELYQDGTIKMKKQDPYDANLIGIADVGFGGMDLLSNGLEGMRNANTKGDITTNAMFADETEYEQPAKRGMRSLNTRLDLGDSGAKYAMIKGQNRAEFGGFMRDGGLAEGEVYDLSMDQIKEIIANGGQIEFI